MQIGDIVYFHSNTEGAVHSSIVDSINYVGGVKKVRLESKFGVCGVYTHSFEDTAYIYDYDYYTVYRYVQGEHDYYAVSIEGSTTNLRCSVCLSNHQCLHNATCTSVDAYEHNILCYICRFDIDQVHSAGLPTATMSMTYHDITCPDCGYTYTESHQWIYNGSKYMCTLCLKTSSQRPPNIMEWIEGEEMVAALPPVNDEEEYIE